MVNKLFDRDGSHTGEYVDSKGTKVFKVMDARGEANDRYSDGKKIYRVNESGDLEATRDAVQQEHSNKREGFFSKFFGGNRDRENSYRVDRKEETHATVDYSEHAPGRHSRHHAPDGRGLFGKEYKVDGRSFEEKEHRSVGREPDHSKANDHGNGKADPRLNGEVNDLKSFFKNLKEKMSGGHDKAEIGDVSPPGGATRSLFGRGH